MRRFTAVPILILVAFLLLVPSQLRADGLDNLTFTFNENIQGTGNVSIVWQLPAAPDNSMVDPVPGVGFQISTLATLTVCGVSSTLPDTFGFLNADAGLGVEFVDYLGVALGGVNTMYSGWEWNPVFTPGTYSGIDPASGELATLTISTPEPSSMLLLCAGFLALAGALAVKRAAA